MFSLTGHPQYALLYGATPATTFNAPNPSLKTLTFEETNSFPLSTEEDRLHIALHKGDVLPVLSHVTFTKDSIKLFHDLNLEVAIEGHLGGHTNLPFRSLFADNPTFPCVDTVLGKECDEILVGSFDLSVNQAIPSIPIVW
jgi:hypothetical protein